MNKATKIAILLVVLVVGLDQALKIWVKTHMIQGEEIMMAGSWARLHFVENEGMAFSMALPGAYGKLALSIFRIAAIGFIIYIIRRLIIERYHTGLVYCGALILAGAIGNMVDSAVYGLIFSSSDMGMMATAFPRGGGYTGFLQGNVVDMLFFPVLHGYFPDWLPVWGGEYFEFFRPVFNIADASITTGVAVIIVFQQSFFAPPSPTADPETVTPLSEDDTSGADATLTTDQTA